MDAFQFLIEGNWAHFKKPETSNNPLTHDFITKTALIGLIGAVAGIDRVEMRALFPQLSDDLLYSVYVINCVKKESFGFTLRKLSNIMEKSPRYMEFLKSPKYLVTLALKNERSTAIYKLFRDMIMNNESKFTPVLGLHNCPANLSYIGSEHLAEKKNGKFITKSFISKNHVLNIVETVNFHLGMDKIPSYQNDDFWNLPEKYHNIIYPSQGDEITVTGEYYLYGKGECLWMI